jgi:hypothetical protein
VKARSRGKPKGASGEPDVATRPASNGLLAGTPLRWGRLSESGLASVNLQDGRRANHERGRASGERASNGSVTVSTSSGGECFVGLAPVGSVGVRRKRRSTARNQANPIVGSGMQQAHTVVCGRNRRSREKRHGRHRGRGWQPLHQVFGFGSGTQ